jgi:hypothetical protein
MSAGNIPTSITQPVTDFQKFLNGASQYVIAPRGAKGVAGWVFDIPTGESEDFEADVTDHYTENGSFINDNIVNKPIRVSLSGLIGELVYRKPAGALGALTQVAGRLSQVAALGGNYSPGFVQKTQGILGQAQAAGNSINRYLDTAQNMVKSVSSLFGPQQTAQQKAYNDLTALWKAKTIFSITTPWAYHDSMTVATMGFRQDQDSDDYSTIVITFKEYRAAETKLSTFKGGDTNLNAIQTSQPITQGTVGSDQTFLKSAAGGKPDFGLLPGAGVLTGAAK